MANRTITAAVFDFDGTLIDSDQALVEPFLALGVDPAEISFGHAVAPECERLGISLDAYVDAYDVEAAQPYAGITELLASLGRWGICSNKHPRPAAAELRRLGWHPEVVMCADAFGWRHKSLAPLLRKMGLRGDQIVMVGDSEGDLACAREVGAPMVWAGWNPRVRVADPPGLVAEDPAELLRLFPGIRRFG